MKVGIAVLNEQQKQEIVSKRTNSGIVIQWVTSTRELLEVSDADFWIDCTFSGTEVPFFEKPVLLHAPGLTLSTIKASGKVGRFCAWNTFLNREVWELSIGAGTDAAWIATLMYSLGWKFFLVKDEPGFIAPRMVATVINEAYHTLYAGVSTSEEIDIAMKLGTNYPYGPLEWSKIIGPKQVRDLLEVLAETNDLYNPVFTV